MHALLKTLARRSFTALPVCLLALAGARAHASIALLMEEPYGKFGAVNPTGHAAIYFNHICIDTPTVLRACRDGEYGVVISRYHKIDGYDWIAMPLIGYLYAVDSQAEIPATVDREQVATLRDNYRRQHLLDLAPDDKNGGPPKGEWTELVGSSYDRTIHGFQLDSSPAQDQQFIRVFNDRHNVGHFNLLFHNCADFSRVVFDIYMPHSIHRNFFADAGVMTPKQVARSLVAYGNRNPELNMSAFVIPQVSGAMPRSHPVDGVAESLVKSKKYLIPMVALAPEVEGGIIVAYLTDGRLKLPKGTPVFEIGDEETNAPDDQPSSRKMLSVPPPTDLPQGSAPPDQHPGPQYL